MLCLYQNVTTVFENRENRKIYLKSLVFIQSFIFPQTFDNKLKVSTNAYICFCKHVIC